MTKDAPDQRDMITPSYVETGHPNYEDKSAETPGNFYPNRGQDAPAYKYNNPRYWEYR